MIITLSILAYVIIGASLTTIISILEARKGYKLTQNEASFYLLMFLFFWPLIIFFLTIDKILEKYVEFINSFLKK